MSTTDKHILWFKEISIDDVGIVGGKNASLGEMYQALTPKGVVLPNGFAITAGAYFYFLDKAGIREEIRTILADLDHTDMDNLMAHGDKVRRLILSKDFPPELEEKIVAAYHELSAQFGDGDVDTAVRSSATAEDLPNASFAGQQETYLNIKGAKDILTSCKRCMASLFTNRAIAYRENQGFDHFHVGLSVCVQKMVRADLASSGVTFSIDTESGFDKVVYISGAWGLGENIVQGNVNPDEWYVFKPTLKDQGFRPIVRRQLGEKQMRMVYDTHTGKTVKNIRTPVEDRMRYCLDDDQVLQLARWVTVIEDHYTAKRGKWTPMDIEWALDGQTNKLFIVQARPETVHSQAKRHVIRSYSLKDPLAQVKVLARGHSVGSKMAHGKARVIHDVQHIHEFQAGEILITEMTDPDWAPIMKKAAAIVTNRGGRTCHAAIISRELGVPCVVGCQTATESITTGQMLTVDCSKGDAGAVYEGEVPFEVAETDMTTIPDTKTKIMLILGNPDIAFSTSFLPAKGVGLVRMEFMVSNHIKVHPMALLKPEVLTPEERREVHQLTQGSPSGRDYFVTRLAEGIATIAAAFHPHDVILRFSDFKTNEYASLIGGSHFEPKEDNPMLGWRGASRYYDPKFASAFALECEAVLKVRNEFGLTNLIVMIPFCRTVSEAERVLATMAAAGLKQGENGLKVYAMCEIPSNVILAEQFLSLLDGFSIGSNDLTQLVLGIDRDSELVQHLYDERNPAVKHMLAQVIQVAKRMGKYIGICGQGPSDHPDLCEFLVEQGIESISLSADRVLPTIGLVHKAEQKLAGKQ
jgi:pyruvate,water dikinase